MYFKISRGFKDSRTAELMMQRAKKLKYNAAKKKKLSQLGRLIWPVLRGITEIYVELLYH